MKMNKKLIFGGVGIVLAVALSLMAPPAELTRQSMTCLGIFACAVCFWIGDVFPFFITCMAMFCAFCLTKTVPYGVAVSGISNSILCFMLGAMGISVALTKSGVMKRLAYSIMKLFSPTFRGQTIGLLCSGVIINPLIPSVTAKTAMVMPISKGIADAMGYEPKSKGMHGIWAATFTGITMCSYAFYSSNFYCIYVRGMLDENTQAKFGFLGWLLAAIPWMLILIIGMAIGINLLYKPDKNDSLMSKEYISSELKKLGALSRDEKISILVLGVCVVLWATENSHGLASHVVALTAAAVLMMCGVISVADFIKGVGWTMLLIIAILVGLGNVFEEVGINAYAATLVQPLVTPIAGNPYILLIAITLICYALRFVITSQMTALPIFMSVMLPICAVSNISPWVMGFVILTATSTWNVIYQNTFAMQGFAAYDEQVVYGKLAKSSICFMLVNIVAIIVSIPIWSMMGYIG